MPAQPYNNDDVAIVKEAILFPYILSTLEHDIKLMKASEMKMGDVYARLLKKAQNDTTTAFYEIKKRMRNNGIKILKEERDSFAAVTYFVVRGYEHNFTMPFRTMKYEIKERLGKYLDVDFRDNKTDP